MSASEQTYRSLYRDYLDSTGTQLDPSRCSTVLFLEHVSLLGSLVGEVERRRAIAVLSTTPKPPPNTHVFITVNGDPSKAFDDLRKCVDKLAKRQLFEWSVWVYEQRSESAPASGFHAHILAKLAPSAGRGAKQRAKTSVSTVCDVRNNAIFNWKAIPSVYVGDKYQYITGQKSLEKQPKQVYDGVWRAERGIEPVYYKGIEEGDPRLEVDPAMRA